MRFVDSRSRKLYKAVLLFVPVLVFVSVLALTLTGTVEGQERASLLMLSFGGLVVAVLWAAGMTRRPIFARDRNAYWLEKGWGHVKDATPLSRVHALQLLEVGFFQQLELNLVLADGSRVHVLGHGDQAALRADAGRLAVWLGVPLLTGRDVSAPAPD